MKPTTSTPAKRDKARTAERRYYAAARERDRLRADLDRTTGPDDRTWNPLVQRLRAASEMVARRWSEMAAARRSDGLPPPDPDDPTGQGNYPVFQPARPPARI